MKVHELSPYLPFQQVKEKHVPCLISWPEGDPAKRQSVLWSKAFLLLNPSMQQATAYKHTCHASWAATVAARCLHTTSSLFHTCSWGVMHAHAHTRAVTHTLSHTLTSTCTLARAVMGTHRSTTYWWRKHMQSWAYIGYTTHAVMGTYWSTTCWWRKRVRGAWDAGWCRAGWPWHGGHVVHCARAGGPCDAGSVRAHMT